MTFKKFIIVVVESHIVDNINMQPSTAVMLKNITYVFL